MLNPYLTKLQTKASTKKTYYPKVKVGVLSEVCICQGSRKLVAKLWKEKIDRWVDKGPTDSSPANFPISFFIFLVLMGGRGRHQQFCGNDCRKRGSRHEELSMLYYPSALP